MTETQPLRRLDRCFSIAPMMDWTTMHYRYLARLLSRQCLLYTEMVTTGALLHGDRERFLAHDAIEHPVALQLGGSDPKELAACARFGEAAGFDEINLNVGCPSDRVQNNAIGACLMAEPRKVADAVAAMQDATHVPITVKHRLGINGRESYAELCEFVDTVAATGCRTFIVHARIAILEGLSPKENREIPPLKYDWVHQLKREFPSLEIIINGGFKSLDACREQLDVLDGVMVGREAYQNPWLLAGVDPLLYGEAAPFTSRHDALRAMLPFIEAELSRGVALNHITRHLLGLFHGCAGGRRFRRHLSEQAHKPGADLKVLLDAMALVPEDAEASAAETA
ncbi:tRNA dihydrouridine(20/20a) synthase DusA [Mangrovitalea sediminis]|uniref:tRNA dihydrouridine(20/20a) synthase DusA n=1 Tax=Mangrovitalea sediminis TaxID=1982043 RepID=UPI000BE5E094|nr:tRNA dihydrouridine(20/20a) synthase DusA [Mangrovitalea sediminis]